MRSSTSQAVVLLAALVAGAGCSHHAVGLPGAPPLPPADALAAGNPLLVPVTDREFVWNQVVDAVDDYFPIASEQRVRLVGGVLTEGRIETYPIEGATALEPWRRDSTRGFERWHSTLQSVRRRAVVRVTPQAQGYAIDVAVFKELEDLSRPEHAPVGSNFLRHDGSLVRVELDREAGPATLGWIPQGRDRSLEQQILAQLRGRLSERQPVHRPPAAGH